jgi:uncharacterized protein (TIGR03084 family)
VADILPQLLHDLEAEGAALDELVAGLDAQGWHTPTPAEPWTVADVIGHLVWTDRVSLVAATEPDRFGQFVEEHFGDLGEDAITASAQQAADVPHDQLLSDWRGLRTAVVDALRDVPEGRKLPWFGPPMSAASMATARLMETWAHGRDVADALGVERTPTLRLRHVAHLAVRTRGFAYQMHDLEPPHSEVRVELDAPDGTTWSFGPPDADQRVTGSAHDFCLLAVQRVHRKDTDLVAEGEDADQWLDVIQAFAGPPGDKRAPQDAA